MNEPNPEETIFAAARQLPPEDRAACLDQACGDNEPLRRRIEALLNASEQSGAFLEVSAAPTLRRTPAASIPLAEKSGDKVGRYKLLQQIGEGGCGVVYMAEQEEPVRRRVALKIIKLGMDTRNVIARFEAERQALAMMDHPNIAKVFDAGATETGRPYFVMELVRGMKITDYCDETQLSIRARLDLFMQVCHAIQHAHQKGIIHRDIKPSNILVTVNDGVPVPKVIDFGIVKATGGQQLTDKTIFTAFEQFIGTPAYMSPEQAVLTSVDIDTRSDIYALGVLLYELLTGKTPFDAGELLAAGLDELRRTIREQEPVRPSTRLSTMPDNELSTTAQRRGLDAPLKLVTELCGDLDWIVMKCVEKDRARRYETANGLAMDIQRHLNNEPVVARPPNNFYRFQKMVRRNKLAFGATCAVVVAILIGFGVSTWMFFGEREAKREQVRLRELAEASVRQAKLEETRTRAVSMARILEIEAEDGNWVRVDQGIDGLLIPADVDNAANPLLLEVRGRFLARRGRFHEAVVDFSAIVKLGPLPFTAPTDTNSFFKSIPLPFRGSVEMEPHFELAPLLILNGDLAGYRLLSDLMLARFGQTTDPGVADLVAKSCLLLPPSESDLKRIADLADMTLQWKQTPGVDNLPWYHFCKGLAEYRRDHYESAAVWLQKTLSESLRGSDDKRFFAAYMVLAMAHYRMGHLDQAHADYAKGEELAGTKLPHLGSNDLGYGWVNVLHGYIFMREAKALIEGVPEAKSKTK